MQSSRDDIVFDPRYQVERELGGGGMATVFLAYDSKQDRKVAIKVLRPELTAAVGGERFLREIKLTAKLTHPHILPLLDSGETGGVLYYVMPYVQGESLRDRLMRERKLPVRDAVQIARETADALAYAHREGVVHRDIKPDNILLAAGHAVIADFGIAQAHSAGAEDSLTSSGMAVGTPAYMSPEQAMGEVVDHRTDIYSLGCVLYEMLTGDTPINAASTMALMAKKLTTDAPSIHISRTDVPQHVRTAAAKAMSREVVDRYRDAADFVAALEANEVGATWITREPESMSIAVLPFTTRGGSGDDEYLGDGISEELIHALGRLKDVKVIARGSSFAFKNASLEPREIAHRLKVDRIVEGSARISGSALRVSVQLIDPESGFQIWSERYDRKLDDIFAIQDEISSAISSSVAALLQPGSQAVTVESPASAAHALTNNVEAYESFLRGRFFFAMRTEEGLRRSILALGKAIELDGSFALSWAGLADAWVMLGLYGMEAPQVAFPNARAAVDRALELDSSLGEAFTTRASIAAIHDHRWEDAAADFERGISLSPQYPLAFQWYAMNYFVPLARTLNAHESLDRAESLDPLSLAISVSRIAIDYYARDYDEVVRRCELAIRVDEHFAMNHYFLGLGFEQLDRPVEAMKALERAAELSPSTEIYATLARMRLLAGNAGSAEALRQKLEAQAQAMYVSPVLLAQMDLTFGNEARALERLEAGVARRAADLIWIGVRPTFDPLRNEGRFKALLADLRLPNIQ